MAEKTISSNGVRMGRPPLGVKATVVHLGIGVPERIDALVGKRRRSEFIRDAVEHALNEREAEREQDTPAT